MRSSGSLGGVVRPSGRAALSRKQRFIHECVSSFLINRNTDTPGIGLVHEPDYFDTMMESRPFALQVSGHTHGGQCRVPIIGYAPARVKYARKYLEVAHDRGDSRLFVSRGLGTSGFRVRFACPPEVAILTLRSV